MERLICGDFMYPSVCIKFSYELFCARSSLFLAAKSWLKSFTKVEVCRFKSTRELEIEELILDKASREAALPVEERASRFNF